MLDIRPSADYPDLFIVRWVVDTIGLASFDLMCDWHRQYVKLFRREQEDYVNRKETVDGSN